MALSLWRVITLSLCGASAVRLQYRAAQPPLVRCSPPRCDAGPESAVAAEDEEEEDKSVKLVPMSTPLGFDELEPAPGPPVPTLQDGPSDGRAVFVSVGMFKAGMMPSEELTARYVQWLSGKRTDDNGQLVTVEPAPSVGLCRASYLNAQQAVLDEIEDLGVSVTEEELSAMGEPEEEGDGMTSHGAQFVLGNLNVLKAGSRAEAEAWAQGDPHVAAEGYESLVTHRWLRSTDPELTMPAPGPSYGVYCLDKPDATALRAATRDAHLEWLKAGGRVTLAGPLQSPEGEEAGNVGTLLVVNGDELGEVQAWAAEDPYNQAGLFASVLVAPLTQYALSAAGGMLTEL